MIIKAFGISGLAPRLPFPIALFPFDTLYIPEKAVEKQYTILFTILLFHALP